MQIEGILDPINGHLLSEKGNPSFVDKVNISIMFKESRKSYTFNEFGALAFLRDCQELLQSLLELLPHTRSLQINTG